MLENKFQAKLIVELKTILPGCIVLKNDANYLQGFPDLTILWKEHWIVLECKRSSDEAFQPNQAYYVGYCNDMSFARVIYPENKEEVIYEIQQTFQPRRQSRLSKS